MKAVIQIIILQWLCFFAVAQKQSNHQSIAHLELPAIGKGDNVVYHLGYSLLYSEQHENPKWVAYELTSNETQRAFERTNKFLEDPFVSTGTADDFDYKGSGFDRGHLAPAADMGWSEVTMKESFYYSNMSPQLPGFNRGIWKKLEEQVRGWAQDYDSIYIVTGPVLKEGLPKIGHNDVSVPEYYYKVILDYTLPDIKAIGFILPNESSTESLHHFAVSIDSVEKFTGINFFPQLPDIKEKELERQLCLPCWSWDTKTIVRKSQHKSSGSSIQCKGTTKAGNRCRNNTKNSSGFCMHHENQAGSY